MAIPPRDVRWFPSTTPDWNLTTGTTRVISISANAGDQIAVFSGVADGTVNWAATPVTNDGAALTWTQQEVFDDNSANRCMMGLWTATLDTTRTIAVTVTRSAAGLAWGADALVASGSDGFGAAESTNNGTGTAAPSLAITTTQANSMIGVISLDWTASAGARTYRTVDGKAPFEYRYDGSPGVIYTVTLAHYADAGAAGPQTVGVTAPALQRYVIAAIEIKGSASGSPTPQAEATLTRSAMRDMARIARIGRL